MNILAMIVLVLVALASCASPPGDPTGSPGAALMAGQEDPNWRTQEAVRKLREQRRESAKNQEKATPKPRPKPARKNEKYGLVFQNFPMLVAIRMIAMLESDTESFELELKAAELE